VLGAATAMRGMAFGRLERIGIDRAIARISDHATFKDAFGEGLTAPQAALSGAHA
jgi:hypothetical protein